jgi:hypothetical protein
MEQLNFGRVQIRIRIWINNTVGTFADFLKKNTNTN